MKLLVVFTALLSFSSYSASISKFRIYLDEDKRGVEFRVLGDKRYDQSCEIGFDYIAYEEGSVAKPLTQAEKNALISDARSMFRFSPRKFNLQRGGHQNVKFMKKRVLTKVDEEKRVYMALKCSNVDSDNSSGMISLTPRLVHTIPLIIRSGKPQVDIKFDNLKLEQNSIAFELRAEGQRSVFGTLKLLAKDGTVLDRRRGVALYPEAKYKKFTFGVPNERLQDAQLVFEENKAFGGSINISHGVKG
jgi:anti-anti-sigma regulatory factor